MDRLTDGWYKVLQQLALSLSIRHPLNAMFPTYCKDRLIRCLFLLVWSVALPAPAAEWHRILEKGPERLIIEITAPSIQPDTLADESGLSTSFRFSPWPLLQDGLNPALPFQTLLIDWPVQEVNLRILSAAAGERTAIAPLGLSTDLPVTGTAAVTAPWQRELRSGPARQAEVEYGGAAGRQKLWLLRIYPWHYDAATGMLSRCPSMRLELTGSGALPLATRLPALAGSGAVEMAASAPLARISGGDQGAFSAPGRVRFTVDEPGWYRVTGADLRKAGIDLLDIDVARLRLSCGGTAVPFFFNGGNNGQLDAGESVEFYGTGLRREAPAATPDLYQDPFSRSNVYWLDWEGEAGVRMEEEYSESATSRSARIPYAFFQTVHVEQDNYFTTFDDISMADSLRDHWLYDGGLAAGHKRSYPFSLRYPDARSLLPVKVRVMLTGLTTAYTEPHQAAVFLNDRFAARGRGERQGIIDLQSQEVIGLLAASLSAENNTLTLVNEFDPTRTDYIALNWFEVTYPRLYRADGGWLEFTIPPEEEPGFFRFTIDGFADEAVEIFKLGASRISGTTAAEATARDGLRSMHLQFYDTVPSHDVRYIAVAASAKKSPLRIEAVRPQWQPSSTGDIDYVVIAPRSFLAGSALNGLMQHRQSQGHRAAGVAVEDIFNYLNHGRRSPLAIKAFLKWAAGRWPLKYCLLAGDGSFLRTPVRGDTLDLVPVYMRQTLKYGASASDFWYTLLEGEDEIPDLCIGRLPARTPDQLEVVVDKIIDHETGAVNGDWHNRLLFVGGNTMIFRTKGMALAAKAPPAWSPAMLFTTSDPGRSPDPFFGNTPELLDFIDQGCSVIGFHGHGGGAIWSDDGLLGLEDVAAMNNRGRYPLILSMTCFTGAFEQPVGENLAETMLFAPEKGTMAFFGAGGYGWLENDDMLQSAIMSCLYENPEATLGELLTAGKIRYFSQYYGSDIARAEVNQYTIFGDPATRLNLPTARTEVEIANPLAAAGDTLAVTLQWPFAPGTATVEYEIERGLPIAGGTISFGANRTEHRMPLPAAAADGDGILRFHGVDGLGLQQTHGAARFSLGRAFFDSMRVIPAEQDSLRLLVQLYSRTEPHSVFCLFRGDTLRMEQAGPGWYSLAVKSYWVPLSCQFLAFYAGGGAVLSGYYAHDPAGRLNIEAMTDRLSWGGEERPTLFLPVMNWGNGSGMARIALEYRQDSDGSWHHLAGDTVAVRPYTGALAAFPFWTSPGTITIRFRIETGQAGVLETRTTVTPVHYALQAGAGFRFFPGTADTLRPDDRALCIASPNSVGENCVLRVERLAPAQLHEQPDFAASSSLPVYSLHFSRPESIAEGVLFSITVTGADSLPGAIASAALFRLAGDTRKWVRLPAAADGGRITAPIRESGLYTLLWAADDQPPEVDAAFDGRPYAENAWVNRTPTIALQLRDQNGIDTTPGRLQFLLDGRLLDENSWSLPDSIINGNLIALNLRPELQPGPHTLSVTVSDCNGNTAAAREFTIQVAEAFHLKMLGNYPNPFALRTTFVYLLSSSADKVSLRIYTAAGRLIRDFNSTSIEDPNPLSADYHEITWDGRDEEGYEVANGVYFYRLTARSGDKSEEITGKIARLR
ncbi:MAG TPA: C25 family cysteine peptidase [bacterium]|nr:C25 family cysteine peptidase [bacterium]